MCVKCIVEKEKYFLSLRPVLSGVDCCPGFKSTVKYYCPEKKNKNSTQWAPPSTSQETEKEHTELKFCLMTFDYFLGNVLAKNLPAVFPDFKLGWIAARTFGNYS